MPTEIATEISAETSAEPARQIPSQIAFDYAVGYFFSVQKRFIAELKKQFSEAETLGEKEEIEKSLHEVEGLFLKELHLDYKGQTTKAILQYGENTHGGLTRCHPEKDKFVVYEGIRVAIRKAFTAYKFGVKNLRYTTPAKRAKRERRKAEEQAKQQS